MNIDGYVMRAVMSAYEAPSEGVSVFAEGALHATGTLTGSIFRNIESEQATKARHQR